MKKIALGLAAVALLATGVTFAAKKVEDPEAGGTQQPAPVSTQLTAKQELGCSIALCMANPNGPTAVAECVPPIRERAKLIAKGKPIPKCPGYNDGTASTGGGNTGGGGSRDDNARTQQN